MIIQCDHCSAKFRMDDSKLANGPVKVRCAKCKEVFVVQKEEPAADKVLSPQPVTAPLAENESFPKSESASNAGAGTEAAGYSFDTPGNSENPFSENSTDFSFAAESPSAKNETAPAKTDSANEFDWHGTSPATAADSAASAFDLPAFDASIASPNVPTDATAAPVGDNDFNFGDMIHKSESTPAIGSSAAAASVQVDDFAMDFGDISFSGQAAVHNGSDSFTVSAAEEFTASSGISAQDTESSAADDFILSFNSDSGQQSPPVSAAAEEPEKDNFGEFSFSEADDSVTAANIKPAARLQAMNSEVFAPAEATQEYQEEELPPLSLTSRKKSGSLFPLVVILGAIVLIIILAGSGVYFIGGPKAFSKVGLGFLVEWYGDKGSDDGSIALKGVTAAYTVNSSAGELFVVRGEAVNNFKKPRASIQIKVSLLGAGGATLVTKSAFCGNSLSSEQLASLPLVKIEETMNNQFGDSLANLGLKPGEAIPFVVVVTPIPKDATDYNVQVGGSTVATQ